MDPLRIVAGAAGARCCRTGKGVLTDTCIYTNVVFMKQTKGTMKRHGDVKFDECACYNTRKAARLLGQLYDRALEPSGLKNTQFATLAAIAGSDAEVTITGLATGMGVDRTTLTRNLSLMVRDGLVSIDAGADARSKLVVLTAEGGKALDTAVPLWQQVQSSITRSLDWDKLLGDIEKLAEVAREAQ